jgi:hypothetical protein
LLQKKHKMMKVPECFPWPNSSLILITTSKAAKNKLWFILLLLCTCH